MPTFEKPEMPEAVKVMVLRNALQELVDRRREVANRIGHITGQAFEGSDLRYKRAQEALDLTA